MFTGIITAIGQIQELIEKDEAIQLTIESKGFFSESKLGDSVAINGVCLTIVDFDENMAKFFAQIETNKKTTIPLLKVGDEVNLEHPLRLNDRLGGHLVQGHVDGTIEVQDTVENSDGSVKMTFKMGSGQSKYLALHGSVCVDGVSLTVSDKSTELFSVALIPATLEHTTLSRLKVGDRANLEVDCLVKYVEQLMEGNKK